MASEQNKLAIAFFDKNNYSLKERTEFLKNPIIFSFKKNPYYCCNDIRTATISDGITCIPDKAFKNCVFLTKIYIPASVTTIGNHAFENCGDLTEVVFEDITKIKSIGIEAFSLCSKLEKIDPRILSVPSIGRNAFMCCFKMPDYEKIDSKLV